MSRLRLQCGQLVTYCALIRKTRGIGDEAKVHSSEFQLQVYLLIENPKKNTGILFGFILACFPWLSCRIDLWEARWGGHRYLPEFLYVTKIRVPRLCIIPNLNMTVACARTDLG